MKYDKFQENLSLPGIIDAATRRLKNTRLQGTSGRSVIQKNLLPLHKIKQVSSVLQPIACVCS